MRKLIFLFLICGFLTSFFSCRNDELDPNSIFEDGVGDLDSTSYSYPLDLWLYNNYLTVYNLQFRYKMQDVGSDMNYNLVPVSYNKSIDMSVLVKYLWFDVYSKIVRPDFLKEYGPRIIHLIGSPAYNPTSGTMILGLAEGGLKITLFRCNDVNINNVAELNEYYFKTMHHEFAHILHQQKTYPKDFGLISLNYYEPLSWQDRDDKVAASLGFVSSYAGGQTREDFVEVIANYIVKTDVDWKKLMDNASKGWVVKLKADGDPEYYTDEYGRERKLYVEAPDTDGVDGVAVINKKLSICRQWLRDSWNIELDSLRKEVQYRQTHIDMDFLRNQLKSK
ncbi:MAG: putative zinc-binding metallopeptidase [Dysgonamonadaceae bacterium]|jgi:substrate import-associated zinc metallohydrolase lipoprotein|nr:putative zinc-binding metallopeptidase [Dysgonamonadaceae bacterium]